MITYLRLLLLPFSILYGMVTLVRNKLYDTGLFKSTKFDIPVICVGNLVVGGSGKSPVIEYLVNLFPDHRIAILSRGYGRNTRGFLRADEKATAKSIGDEPMQFYHKFPQLSVAVCEDRVKGIRQLKENHDLILLDDGFQHRSVNPGFSILLFEYEKLLTRQFLLPAGNLREPFSGYKRAQAVLITKAPVEVSQQQKECCLEKFNASTQNEVAFSFLKYEDLKPLYIKDQQVPTITQNTHVFLLSGIANPKPLVAYLKQHTTRIQHFDHPDHYQFTRQDIQKLIKAYQDAPVKEKLIITTEKDAQRLLDATLKELLLNLPVFYLPVKIALREEDKTTFDQKILNYVSSTTRNR